MTMLTLALNTHGWLVVGGILVALVLVLVLIDRLFAWLSKNGARVMRNDKAAGAMSGILGTFEGFLRPEKQMVEEEREQRKAVIDETDPSNR